MSHQTSRQAQRKAIPWNRLQSKQLSQLTGGSLTGEIAASGITSDKGELVLVFNFSTEDRQITQYYICGDQEHILIYETNFSSSSECDEAAQTIMNTFEWSNRD